MENANYIDFLNVLHQAMFIGFGISLAVAVIIFITYWVRYSLTKDFKERYDLVSTNEINTYLRVNYAVASAIFFIANTAYEPTILLHPLWVFIRFFISFCLATLHIYIAYLIFKYYYPRPLNKKLEKLRYTPRVNPATGNKMKLLSEAEEDAYLDEGMQAEENVFSVDYDVWIDPETKETRIEKYKGHLSALECDRCGFQTLRLEKEEVIRQPEEGRDGEIEKEYECTYCGRIKRKTVKLTVNPERSAALSAIDASAKALDSEVELIRIEIRNARGDSKTFDFQTRDQARKFMDQFDFSKLGESKEKA